jgi:hypothetical protein
MVGNQNETVTLIFSQDEALVLFELIHRISSQQSMFFEHPAEERILFDLEADLEKSISSILTSDYSSLLVKAREQVRDKEV